MADLDFAIFDADNHYYEAEDAFTRHIDPRMAKRAMQWGQVDGRKTLLVGGKINRFIPNPTFDPVAKPGCLEQYFRGRNPNGLSMRELFGQLEPIRRAYRERDERLAGDGRAGHRARVPLPDARRRHGGGAARATPRRSAPPSTRSTSGSTRTGASPGASACTARRC